VDFAGIRWMDFSKKIKWMNLNYLKKRFQIQLIAVATASVNLGSMMAEVAAG
jgi:hypothetical protein